MLLLVGALSVFGLYLYLKPRLPDIEALKDVRLQVPLRIYARGGELIAEFGEMKRNPLKYEEFPPRLINAVLAAEDDRFFEHPGVDYQGILRAALELITSGGEVRSGGSTITMQVARNFFLSREKTFMRKFNEIFLSFKIEEELSKEDILALYLNKIFLGNRSYGFGAAAQVYYGKPLGQLSLAQTATLAGLPKAPSRYNPIVNPERAIQRRGYVLERMHKLGFINDDEFSLAMQEADDASVHGQAIDVEAPYVAEMVRSEMLSRFGNDIYSAGFEVYTTIDKHLQETANSALRNALLEYDRRHGYRGHIQFVDLGKTVDADPITRWSESLSEIDAVGNLEPAIVFEIDTDANAAQDIQPAAYAYTKSGRIAYLPWDHIDWARRYVDDNHVGPELKSINDILKVGDVIYVTAEENGCSWLAEVPTVTGALVSLNPQDGSLNALIGGFDYFQSKFNRATQAERQPGSSFKPFIYSGAINKGFTAASIINDAPVVFDAPGLEDTWRPENYSGKVYGETRLREALVKSRNLVSIRLLRDIGIGYAVRYARRFGLENAKLPRDLSLALGSGTLTPIELATGYSVFANGGYRISPNFISYIAGPDGTVIYVNNPPHVCADCVQEAETGKDLMEAENDNPGEAGLGAPPETAESTTPAPGTEQAAAQPSPQEQAAQTAPAVPVQQDTLQAFLVADDKQVTIEDNIRREVQFNEGPVQLNPAPRIISPQNAFLMNSMMRDVIKRGTGMRARELGRNDLAGKTGTTNDQHDAWFSGFNSDIVTICWVGFNNPKPLGSHETGARAALPMWISFMREALRGKEETPLIQPPGIVSVRINGKTGLPTTATDPEAIFEFFLEDQVPSTDAQGTTQKPVEQQTDITREIF